MWFTADIVDREDNKSRDGKMDRGDSSISLSHKIERDVLRWLNKIPLAQVCLTVEVKTGLPVTSDNGPSAGECLWGRGALRNPNFTLDIGQNGKSLRTTFNLPKKQGLALGMCINKRYIENIGIFLRYDNRTHWSKDSVSFYLPRAYIRPKKRKI